MLLVQKTLLMMTVISPLSGTSMLGNPSDSVLSITHSQQGERKPQLKAKYGGSDNNRRHMPDAIDAVDLPPGYELPQPRARRCRVANEPLSFTHGLAGLRR
jgi:hypothetical protein